jgi:hypothetical protein
VLEDMIRDMGHNVASGLVPDVVHRRGQAPTLQHWTVTRSGCLCDHPEPLATRAIRWRLPDRFFGLGVARGQVGLNIVQGVLDGLG